MTCLYYFNNRLLIGLKHRLNLFLSLWFLSFPQSRAEGSSGQSTGTVVSQRCRRTQVSFVVYVTEYRVTCVSWVTSVVEHWWVRLWVTFCCYYAIYENVVWHLCLAIHRYHDAGYYFWKLSVQCLDLVGGEGTLKSNKPAIFNRT